MIMGVGVDACGISRMEKLIGNAAFLKRFFTDEEAAYIASKGAGAAQTMAGLYAAKEAALKALGTGLNGIPLGDVAVRHHPMGQPYYTFSNKALAALGDGMMHLSITHEGDLAIAFAVLEMEGKIHV